MPITAFRPQAGDVDKHNFLQIGLSGAAPNDAAIGNQQLFIACDSNLVYRIDANKNIEALTGPGGTASLSCAHTGVNLCVGTQSTGVLYSTDDGNTWNASDYPLTRGALLASDQKGNTLAGWNTGNIYRSTNDGVNWTPIALPSTMTGSGQALKYLPDIDTFIVRGSFGELMWSQDGGATWQETASPALSGFFVVAEFFNNQLYLGDSEGIIYTTDDFGVTATEVANQNVNNDSSTVLNVNVKSFATFNNEIYAGLDTSVFQILHSENGQDFELCMGATTSATSSTDACNILIEFAGNIYSSWAGAILRNLED